MNEPAGVAGNRAARGAAAYDALFARLAVQERGAFVPFAVLGDPDPATSLALIKMMARSGADALEVGLPFSDPVADGPAIQAASLRARSADCRMENAWEIVAAVRAEFPLVPIGVLVYANLVLHGGAERFYARAAAAGADSVLVADAPLLESSPLERMAADAGIAPVLIAPPNADPARLAEAAARSRGYVYVTARPGVTGVRSEPGGGAARVLARLRALRSAPPLVGFGISRPEHVRQAIAAGAAGAISGSAIARIIEAGSRGERLLADIASFVNKMKDATGPPTGT